MLIFTTSCAREPEEQFSRDYSTSVLDNGATVVCKYMPDSPLVTIQVRVLSGLSNEGEYAGSGISHFLEHLLFKGARGKTSEEIRSEIKAMGGIVNGATGQDSAEYHITVPNGHFNEALGLIVSMVFEPVFTDEEMGTERDVILKEMNFRNDDPISKRWELLYSQAYRVHVYKYPIMGYEELFKGLTRGDILRYHSGAYTPARTVVGIAGGIQPDIAISAAEKKLGQYEKRRPWQVDILTEPRQVTERKALFPADVTLGYIAIGFHSSSLYSPDLYSGDVLNILLGEGNDSRLYKRLVNDDSLLYTVSSVNYTLRYPGLFVITGIGPPHTLERAKEEIFDVIEELKRGKIKNSEIERARNQVISEYLHANEQVDSMASVMTSSQMLTGDPAFFEKYVEETKKVGKKEVIDAASRYLTRDNATTVMLVPPEYIERELRDQSSEARTVEEERAVTLENGLRVIVRKKGSLPLVSVAFAAFGGVASETPADSGISNLTASVLLKGTRKRKENGIIPAVERMGGVISAFSGMNSIGVTMDILSEKMDEGLDIFEDVIKNPVFPDEEIKKQKEKITANISEEDKDIFERGMQQLRKLLYGSHPYSMRVLGAAGSVQSMSREKIISFYNRQFAPENAVITVVGDVDADAVIKDIGKRFAGWRGEKRTVRGEAAVEPLEKTLEEGIVMGKEQSLVLAGFQGSSLEERDKYILSVITAILSGSDGLLFYAVREQEGLAYTSGAVSVPMPDKGYVVLYAATTEENLEKTEQAVFDVIRRVQAGGITDEEIDASRNRLIAQKAYSLETNYIMSMTMVLDELYGLGYDNYKEYSSGIASVTKEDIIRCAKEKLDLNRCAIVLIHSEEQ